MIRSGLLLVFTLPLAGCGQFGLGSGKGGDAEAATDGDTGTTSGTDTSTGTGTDTSTGTGTDTSTGTGTDTSTGTGTDTSTGAGTDTSTGTGTDTSTGTGTDTDTSAPVESEPRCRTTSIVSAPDEVAGDTTDDASDIQIDPTAACWASTYGYTLGRSENHAVTVPAGANLTIAITSLTFGGTGEASVFVLDDCTPAPSMGYCTSGYGTCIASASCLAADKGAAPTVRWSNATGSDREVWIVIDGHPVSNGAYTLDVRW